MARDLIPPTSPAGKPTPDGKGSPTLIELPPEPPRGGAEPAQQRSAPSQFRNRFGFLLGALAGVVVAVAAVVIVSASTGDGTQAAGLAKNFSKWHPAEQSVDDGAPEIADHVGAEYKLGDGSQLTMVKGGPINVLDPNVKVALRPTGGTIHEFNANHGVLYTLVGLGPGGSMQGGKASVARLRLLRREALELALYSFRYLKDVDMVVTLMPTILPGAPGSSGTATTEPDQQAIFYRPGDLKPQLQVPLGLTVPAKTPNPDTIKREDGQKIDLLTTSNTFHASLVHSQTGEPYLVLDRVG